MYAQYSNSAPTTPSRSSSSSTHSGIGPAYPSVTAGDVPTTVHSLLASTRRLQDVLKEWSLRRASQTQVSDAYVQIATEFNAVIAAFVYHQIDLSDLHSVPQEMRNVLEQCLAEEPTPEALAHFMPELKQILLKLLKGLHIRQDAWRARAFPDSNGSRSLNASPRNSR